MVTKFGLGQSVHCPMAEQEKQGPEGEFSKKFNLFDIKLPFITRLCLSFFSVKIYEIMMK